MLSCCIVHPVYYTWYHTFQVANPVGKKHYRQLILAPLRLDQLVHIFVLAAVSVERLCLEQCKQALTELSLLARRAWFGLPAPPAHVTTEALQQSPCLHLRGPDAVAHPQGSPTDMRCRVGCLISGAQVVLLLLNAMRCDLGTHA